MNRETHDIRHDDSALLEQVRAAQIRALMEEARAINRRAQTLRRDLEDQKEQNKNLRAQLKPIPQWVVVASIKLDRLAKQPAATRLSRSLRHPFQAARRLLAVFRAQLHV